MPALFYKKYWHIVGEEVIVYVLNILNNKAPIEQINHTQVVLIPKKKVYTSTKDYRPVSLCNVMYKLVSKAVSSRLKSVLSEVISESQSAFVPGRLITDNVLVCLWFTTGVRRRTGSSGILYKVWWRKWGSTRSFGEIIMRCITSVS